MVQGAVRLNQSDLLVLEHCFHLKANILKTLLLELGHGERTNKI